MQARRRGDTISQCEHCWLPAMMWGAESGSPDRIRSAAEKALALIQTSQKNWYGKYQQSCSSCHHQMLPALAYRAAREHGLKFDEAAARTDAIHGSRLVG